MARLRQRHKPMAQINVVPYIDVMLVLLIIFMVTAPLLQQGVEVDLPNAPSQPLSNQSEQEKSLIVTVNNDGQFYLRYGSEHDQSINDDSLGGAASDILAQHADATVYVKGDQHVDYGRVITAMVILKNAGAKGIGLITDPPDDKSVP